MLEDQGRPCITFDRTQVIINAVCGMQIDSRTDVTFLPRLNTPGQVKANEVLSSASDWMDDGCDAEDEQSEAFKDNTICGMGWTEAVVEYDTDPDGLYVERRINPIEMVWDRTARAKNLVDAKRLFRVRKMTLREAKDMFPGVPVSELNATWAIGWEGSEDPKPVKERRHRTENAIYNDPKSEVHIVHAQWFEKEPFYRVADPMSGQELKLSEEEFKEFQASTQVDFTYVQQHRRVFKQAFLGGSILGDVKPGPCADRFNWCAITGERDVMKGVWFGMVRSMRDPQMWANKFFSQILHILNSTAKGGILAEKSAFKDIRDAQETYAQPDHITFVEDGALGPKIMPKPGQGNAAQYEGLMQFAISSIRDSVGVNLELLGMRDANQAGILEAQRKQAGLTILKSLFDSMRRFKKLNGRVRLHYIQKYFADGRLIRVAGEDGAMMVPLLKDQVLGDYEVIVGESPNSPNQKQETWAILQQIMGAFKEMLTPEVVIAFLEYSPLPSKVLEMLKAQIGKEPSPEEQMQKQLGLAAAQAKISVDQSVAQKNLAQAESMKAGAIMDVSEAAKDQATAELNKARAAKIIADIMKAAQTGQRIQIDENFAMPAQVPVA